MANQDFSKKLAIVIDKKLETWQVLNAVAHISAYIGNKMNTQFDTGDFFVTKDGIKHPRNTQYPIIALRASSGQLMNLIAQVRESRLLYLGFIKEMIETTDDEKIQQILSSKDDNQIEYLGVGIFGSKEQVDALTKKFQLWR